MLVPFFFFFNSILLIINVTILTWHKYILNNVYIDSDVEVTWHVNRGEIRQLIWEWIVFGST